MKDEIIKNLLKRNYMLMEENKKIQELLSSFRDYARTMKCACANCSSLRDSDESLPPTDGPNNAA